MWELRGNGFGSIEKYVSGVPCIEMYNLELQMVLGAEEDAKASELRELRVGVKKDLTEPVGFVWYQFYFSQNRSKPVRFRFFFF